MNTKEIHSLIKFVAESGVAEIKLKTDEFAIHIKNIPEQVAAPAPMPVSNNLWFKLRLRLLNRKLQRPEQEQLKTKRQIQIILR